VNVYQIFPGICDRPGYRRQIVKNGVTLSEKDLEKQDQEHQKQHRAANVGEEEGRRSGAELVIVWKD
jgi:hypothetical protein